MQVICTKATRAARVRRTSSPTPRGKSAFDVQREPKNCCGSSVSQSLAASFDCGSSRRGMLIDIELFFVLVVVVSSNGDGGAEDLEAEAKEIGSCGDETRWEIMGWA